MIVPEDGVAVLQKNGNLLPSSQHHNIGGLNTHQPCCENLISWMSVSY